MKKILFVAVLMLSAVVFGQTAPTKIGYVDSKVILEQFPDAIKAQGELDALVEKWQGDIDSMKQDLQALYGEYQKNEKKYSEKQKNDEQQKLIKKQQVLEDYQRAKFGQQTGELYQKQEQFLKPVKKKIFEGIEQVAKDQGMQFVFDKTGDILLLYADSTFDITYKVLDKLKTGK